MIEVTPREAFVEITARGKLTQEDYDVLVPELERLADRRGPLGFYIELRDFEGWEPAALWEDLKFDARHQDEMDRVAVVGEKQWQEWGTRLSDPFFKAEVAYFAPEKAEEARRWVAEG